MHEGTFNGLKVCVEKVRMYSKGDPQKANGVCYPSLLTSSSHFLRIAQTFHREAVTWKHLSHPNIVPFLGVTFDPLQLVSAWMPGGSLTEYIKEHPSKSRLVLVCFVLLHRFSSSLPRQLHGVVEGLNYLHSRSVIHGDIKGVRVRHRLTGNLKPNLRYAVKHSSGLF
jgi:serine/threonine protein kinase